MTDRVGVRLSAAFKECVVDRKMRRIQKSERKFIQNHGKMLERIKECAHEVMMCSNLRAGHEHATDKRHGSFKSEMFVGRLD